MWWENQCKVLRQNNVVGESVQSAEAKALNLGKTWIVSYKNVLD